MLKILSREIKQIFILTTILDILAFFLGLFLNNNYLIALCLGITASIFSNIALLFVSYLVVYQDYGISLSVIRYVLNYIFYAVVLYTSGKLYNIKALMITALGLLSFRLLAYLIASISNRKAG